MSANKSSQSSYVSYSLDSASSKKKDFPTSSILKTPTPIFVTGRNSSGRTRRLTFANGSDGTKTLNDVMEESHVSASTKDFYDMKFDSETEGFEEKLVEVMLSPVNKMKVSPESWKAFLEYQKYEDHSNETEKTDYTYSRLSRFRDREIIPGFRIRPNLSRRPLHGNGLDQQSRPGWLSEADYCLKNTTYQCVSSMRKINTVPERNNIYYNEFSDYIDSSIDNAVKIDKYKNSHPFGDDGKILKGRDGFGYNTPLSGLSHSLENRDLDYVDADGYFISSTNNGENTSSIRKLTGFLTVIYVTIFQGITSVFGSFVDLFSRYILRKNTDYPYTYSSLALRPWSRSGTYLQGTYAKNKQGILSNWWHQSFLYAFYSKIVSTMYNSTQYVRTKFNQSSRRVKFIWFFLPLLLLLGLWLFRAEGEEAYVSKKIHALKFKANQYLAPGLCHMYNVNRKISSYYERIFGRSLQPLRSLFGWFISISGYILNFLLSLLSGALSGIFSVFELLKNILGDILSYFSTLLLDIIENKNDISNAVYNFFSDVILSILSGLSHIMGTIGNLFSNTLDYLHFLFFIYPFTETNDKQAVVYESILPEQHYGNIEVEWELLRKRIEALETELAKVQEEKGSSNLICQRQLESNYKALQKYQVIVNEALRRQSTKPVHLSKGNLQYYMKNATDELKKWILASFMLKTDPKDIDDNKLALLMAKYSNSSVELKTLQDEFLQFKKQYSNELSSLKMDWSLSQYQDFDGNDLSLKLIKRMIMDEIKLHDADKTGKVDYALQSAGGHVLGVKCTKNFEHCWRYNDIFGVQVCAESRKNTPLEAINPGMAPGQCWAFSGSQGFLIIGLSHSIIVTGFTMEHVSRLLSPNGRIESAPRKFSMWGLKSEIDPEPYLFGNYEYKDNNETYQYFPVINYSAHPYKIVELSITSNHGNPNYTCLYRIRVHGDLYPSHL